MRREWVEESVELKGHIKPQGGGDTRTGAPFPGQPGAAPPAAPPSRPEPSPPATEAPRSSSAAATPPAPAPPAAAAALPWSSAAAHAPWNKQNLLEQTLEPPILPGSRHHRIKGQRCLFLFKISSSLLSRKFFFFFF